MHRGQRELSRRLAALGLPTVLVLVQACMYAYVYACIYEAFDIYIYPIGWFGVSSPSYIYIYID